MLRLEATILKSSPVFGWNGLVEAKACVIVHHLVSEKDCMEPMSSSTGVEIC
jgi:hypothetical protein